MTLRRTLTAASLALASLIHTSCAAQYGSRETFESGQGDVEAQLRAAEYELLEGRPDNAAEALEALTAVKLLASQQARYQVLLAETALAQDEPLKTLQALPPSATLRDPTLVARAEAVRAKAQFRMGDSVSAVQTLVQRERLLDPGQKGESREYLWNALQTSELDGATGPRLAQLDKVSRGWIALALIARAVWPDPKDLNKSLADWRGTYPQHPAELRIPQMVAPVEQPRRKLGNIALLLPLSGPYAATGEAVRDGFFAAHYASEMVRPAVRVYDTGTTAETAMAAWHEALDNGAEFVVGPLRREDVAQLAADGKPGVPVLALNYLDAGQNAPFNFYQWGLAPEDEARQAAERATADHQYRAIALVPEGDWGARILNAFSTRLKELGGAVVEARTYATSSRDHSDEIKSLLAISDSAERHRALTVTLGQETEFEPRPRADIDLIFIAARPDQAKLIGPQLRFHRSGSVPIYATASIYDGDAPDLDLAGLRFCDMPWMLQENGPWATLRGQLRATFPARGKEYTRLMALGYDSYALVGLIEGGQMRTGSFFPAASGTLALKEGGSIQRGLSCSEVRGSKLRPLDISMPRADAR